MSRKNGAAATAEKVDERSHAERNADGHAESVLEMYRAYKALDEGADSAKVDGYDYNDVDEIRQRAEECALSVEVRGPWHVPGDQEAQKADEFRILLTTGGPALQITGDLTEHGEADAGSSRVMVQDWGTPWTEYRPRVADEDDYEDAFSWFLSCFYFGE